LKDCLIIHLERSLERKPQVRKLEKDLPYRTKVVEAVDGRNPDNDFSKRYTTKLLRPRYPFSLRSAEMACFQSHRKCWQEILDRGLEAALIIEDDVDIIDGEFTAAVNLAMKEIKMGDLVRFPIKPREKPRNRSVQRDNISIFEPILIGLGTQAQIVTYDAARRLLEKTEHFDRPIDVYLQLRWKHGVRVLTLWPNGVRENSSSLGGSLIGKERSKGDKLRREILRPLYRAKVNIYARIKKRKTFSEKI
jgi:GR25 family glycosyltransferase involved in LPS biosynthesis